ncbi:MAG: hypothetical protein KC589_07840 [Nanoarchaeota archaeon]|nr:hypothetical protein [Nanoarchaeota archaeon]
MAGENPNQNSGAANANAPKKVMCPDCKSEDIKDYKDYKSCNNCGKNFK